MACHAVGVAATAELSCLVFFFRTLSDLVSTGVTSRLVVPYLGQINPALLCRAMLCYAVHLQTTLCCPAP